MRYQLRATLGIGVGIITIQRVVFPVAPDPFLVVVDLIGGYVEHATYCIAYAHTFQQIYRTHDIGFIGVAWFLVAVTNDGLCREMQHNLRPGVIKPGFERFKIPYITNCALHMLIKAGKRKQVRLCRRLKTITRDLRSGQHQDAAQPTALETRVTCDQHTLTFVKIQCIHVSPPIPSMGHDRSATSFRACPSRA